MLKSLFDWYWTKVLHRIHSSHNDTFHWTQNPQFAFFRRLENSIFALHRVSSNNDMTAPQTQLHPLYSADYTHCNSAIVPLVEQAIMKCGYDLNLVCWQLCSEYKHTPNLNSLVYLLVRVFINNKGTNKIVGRHMGLDTVIQPTLVLLCMPSFLQCC